MRYLRVIKFLVDAVIYISVGVICFQAKYHWIQVFGIITLMGAFLGASDALRDFMRDNPARPA